MRICYNVSTHLSADGHLSSFDHLVAMNNAVAILPPTDKPRRMLPLLLVFTWEWASFGVVGARLVILGTAGLRSKGLFYRTLPPAEYKGYDLASPCLWQHLSDFVPSAVG